MDVVLLISSSSLLTEWVRGQSLNEVEKIKNSDIDRRT